MWRGAALPANGEYEPVPWPCGARGGVRAGLGTGILTEHLVGSRAFFAPCHNRKGPFLYGGVRRDVGAGYECALGRPPRL